MNLRVLLQEHSLPGFRPPERGENLCRDEEAQRLARLQKLFSLENATLEFTDEALGAIARKAMARDVGARALRAVVEERMLELMYELPDMEEDNAHFVITEEMVESEKPPTLFDARAPKRESA